MIVAVGEESNDGEREPHTHRELMIFNKMGDGGFNNLKLNNSSQGWTSTEYGWLWASRWTNKWHWRQPTQRAIYSLHVRLSDRICMVVVYKCPGTSTLVTTSSQVLIVRSHKGAGLWFPVGTFGDNQGQHFIVLLHPRASCSVRSRRPKFHDCLLHSIIRITEEARCPI